MIMIPPWDPQGVDSFAGVYIYAAVGSAVRFELQDNPNLKIGDTFNFSSTNTLEKWKNFTGDYIVAETAFSAGYYQIYTTCIANVDGVGT